MADHDYRKLITDAYGRPVELVDYVAEHCAGVTIGTFGHKLHVCVDGVAVLRVKAPVIELTDLRVPGEEMSECLILHTFPRFEITGPRLKNFRRMAYGIEATHVRRFINELMLVELPDDPDSPFDWDQVELDVLLSPNRYEEEGVDPFDLSAVPLGEADRQQIAASKLLDQQTYLPFFRAYMAYLIDVLPAYGNPPQHISYLEHELYSHWLSGGMSYGDSPGSFVIEDCGKLPVPIFDLAVCYSKIDRIDEDHDNIVAIHAYSADVDQD